MKTSPIPFYVLCILLWSQLTGKQTKPNIIFIMVDDMGYHDLGCYGSKTISTPNIDRMAKEGIRFTDCYSGDTVCASARSTLMTGYHKGHTPVRGIREESLFSRKISLWLKSSKKLVM